MKKRLALILIMILINLSLVITPTLALDGGDNDLIYYNSVESQEFFDLNPGDKQKVWEDAGTWEDIKKRNEKQTAIRVLTDQIIGERIEANKLTRGYIAIMELGGDVLLQKFKDAGLNDYLGLDLSEIYKNKKNLGAYLKETYGIDFDIQETKLKSIVGFDNSKLKWSTENTGENKNIIGDGTVWLDLEKIPTGVTGIEYKEGDTKGGKYAGGSFILTHNSGMEIVLAPGTTNPDGTIKFLSQYYEDYKVEGDKKLFRIDGINLPPPNLRNFNFPTTSSDGSSITGKVIFTENGFKLTGDAQVKYSQFSFTGTQPDESSQESYVQFHKDKFIIKGTKFERQDYLISQPTKDDFIIHFGTIEYLGKDDEGKVIKDVAIINLDGLVKQASFEDMRIGTIPEINAGQNFASIGQIHFKFNKQGELTYVWKDEFENWIHITQGSPIQGDLKKLYDQSGYTFKKIIDTAAQGESIGYNNIKELFYGDSILKMQAREIKVESYQDNFVSIIGENVFVGGKGDIKILKPLNSLTGVDAKDFKVNVGELPLRFSESGIWKIRGGHEGKTFNIDSITAIKSGELIDTILTTPNNEKKPVPSFTINTNNPPGKIYSESESFTAGRQVVIGPFGSTVDIHLDVPMSDMPDIADNKGDTIEIYEIDEYFGELTKSNREKFIQELMQSEFEFKIDFYIPGKGVKVNKNKFNSILADFVFPKLKDFVITGKKTFPIGGVGEKEFESESFDKIEDMVLRAFENIESDKLSPGRYIIALKNNPKIPMYKNRDSNDIGSEAIKIDVLIPDGTKIPLKTKEEETLFIKDILELTTRAPDTTKGSTPYFFAGVDFRKTNYYPPPHLYYLWKRVLGREEPDLIMRYVTGTNILYSEDEAFLKEYFFNKYFKDPDPTQK